LWALDDVKIKLTDAIGVSTFAVQDSSAATVFRINSDGEVKLGAWLGTTIAIANGGTGATDASTARTNLGLAIGTNVQAQNATLQSISPLGTASDKMLYTTGLNTWAEANLTTAGRAILDDADAAAQRTTLGLGTIATLNTPLGIADGGTGQITANAAFNALAPTQTGQSGKYLTTDGTNTSWATVAGGSNHNLLSATHSDTTAAAVTAGALIMGNAGGTAWEKLPIGPEGNSLSIVNGVISWTDTGAVQGYHRIGATPDRWYTAMETGLAKTIGAPTANNLRAIPIIFTKRRTLDGIAINVTTLLAGTTRLGIYADNGNSYPGALVLDAGAVDTSTIGVKIITINQTINPGLYWLVAVGSSAPTIRCFAVGGLVTILGSPNTLPTTPSVGYSMTFTYGVLPANYAGGTVTYITAVPVPCIYVRISQ
jgi:hypothetical protein